MASRINISGHYGTHLGPLIAVMAFSTPYLHYQCMLGKRHLTSYDNNHFWTDDQIPGWEKTKNLITKLN